MFCVKSNSSIWISFRQFPLCFQKNGIFRAVLAGRILLNKLSRHADVLTNSTRAYLMNLDEILLSGSRRHCPQRRYWTSIKCRCPNAPNPLQKLHFGLSSSPFTIIHGGGSRLSRSPPCQRPSQAACLELLHLSSAFLRDKPSIWMLVLSLRWIPHTLGWNHYCHSTTKTASFDARSKPIYEHSSFGKQTSQLKTFPYPVRGLLGDLQAV